MSAMLLMLAAVCVTMTAFTACSDDDEQVTEVTYTMGFTQMSSSGSFDFIQEMRTIEAAFLTVLGVTDTYFTKSGNNEQCDKEVREACEKAFNTLKGTKWKGSYVFKVTNIRTSEAVCEVVFKANDENFI